MNIKLRAWDTFHQTMIYSSEEGITFKLENGKWSVQYIKEKNFYNGGVEIDAPIWHESDEIEVMLFTGFYDINKKPIYENDVLTFDFFEWNRSSCLPESKWEHPRWIVEWNNEEGKWSTGGGLNRECPIYKEILGNVFEHPHLLQQKQPA